LAMLPIAGLSCADPMEEEQVLFDRLQNRRRAWHFYTGPDGLQGLVAVGGARRLQPLQGPWPPTPAALTVAEHSHFHGARDDAASPTVPVLTSGTMPYSRSRCARCSWRWGNAIVSARLKPIEFRRTCCSTFGMFFHVLVHASILSLYGTSVRIVSTPAPRTRMVSIFFWYLSPRTPLVPIFFWVFFRLNRHKFQA
jgi:hypothetical protein